MDLLRAAIIIASTLVFIGAYAADAPNRNTPPSLEQNAALLVKALQLEPSLRLTLEASVEKAIKQGRADPAERECVKNLDLEFANQAYAAALTEALTPEEMRQAIDFFASPAGKEYMQFGVAAHLKERGLSVPQFEISDETAAKALQFSTTPVGDKLMVRKVHDTSKVKQELATRVLPELMKCKRETAP